MPGQITVLIGAIKESFVGHEDLSRPGVPKYLDHPVRGYQDFES